MEGKIREETGKIEQRIEWKREYLDKAVKDFKESAASYDAYHIGTFMHGKAEEITRYRAEIAGLEEMKQMLEYMLKQEH